MRQQHNDLPQHSAASAGAMIKLAMDKLQGVQMHNAKTVLDLSVQTIRDIIATTVHGIHGGIAGEPTTEDLQRLHELQALLDDLP